MGGLPIRKSNWYEDVAAFFDFGVRQVVLRRATWSTKCGSDGHRLSIQRLPNTPMDTTQTSLRIPNVQFRVLVIGRANAGKTSILQRVCETTESPTIYRGNEEVRGPSFCIRVWFHFRLEQVKLNPSVNVSNDGTSLRLPLNIQPARRAQDRRRACLLQPQGLCFSRFAGNRGGWRRETRDLEGIYPPQVWRKQIAKQIARDMVGTPVLPILIDNWWTCLEVLRANGRPPTRA